MHRKSFFRFVRNRRANVAMIFALAIFVLVFLVGMALDFAVAINRWSVLNAAADSAALAAVSPTEMQQSTSQATTAATNLFNAQAEAVSGVTLSAPIVVVTQNGLSRTATVTYSGSSTNAFSGILNMIAWPLSGTSTASATGAPNIDFYMLLDNSPSMAIAATTAGIATMIANTSGQDFGAGCAFACHQSKPNAKDNAGNPPGMDNYAIAKELGVTTRIQNVAAATRSLTNTALGMESQSGNTLRFAVYTFTSPNLGTDLVPIQTLTSDLSAAGAAASAVDVLEVCKEDHVTCPNVDDDTETDFATTNSGIGSIMPMPGTGAANSTPREVLFIVTDGVEDKKATSCAYKMIPESGFDRCIQPFDTTNCDSVKNNNIEIAILYTEYYPLTSDAFYNNYVAPFQSQIGPNLQNCASPGLFFTVTTAQDIDAAMTTLFQAAVISAEAHLTQ